MSDKPDPHGDQPIKVTRVTVVLPPGHGPDAARDGTVVEGEVARVG